MDKFIFCPNCKNQLDKKFGKVKCRSCGFEFYFDPSPCASVIPINDGKVLLALRKHEPFKGTLDLIGGFINTNETAEHAAIREAKEETGLDMKILSYFGTYPDTYGEGGKHVLGINFITEITGGIQKPADDVLELNWINIKDIPNTKFNGFKNTGWVLKDLHDQLSRGAEN